GRPRGPDALRPASPCGAVYLGRPPASTREWAQHSSFWTLGRIRNDQVYMHLRLGVRRLTFENARVYVARLPRLTSPAAHREGSSFAGCGLPKRSGISMRRETRDDGGRFRARELQARTTARPSVGALFAVLIAIAAVAAIAPAAASAAAPLGWSTPA